LQVERLLDFNMAQAALTQASAGMEEVTAGA